MKRHLSILLLLLLMAGTAFGQIKFRRKSDYVQFKDRIEYTVSPASMTEQIIEHKGFVASYNAVTLNPNWVAYELTKEEASGQEASRTDKFTPDPAVKGVISDTHDYTGSGYDRGHMAPAADMKWDKDAMAESFYMTNICPQDRELNGGAWLELEQKCRYWAKKYGSLYIVTGPYYLNTEEFNVIGDNEVAVPDAFFKAVCQCRNGRWVGVAFVLPNNRMANNTDLLTNACPIVAVEYLTKLNIFANFDAETAAAVKNEVNDEDWIIPNWQKH